MEWKIGDHRLAFEPPDLLKSTIRGDIDERQMGEFVSIVLNLASARPYLLALADLHEMGDIPPEARKIAVRMRNRITFRGMAFYNGRFRTRIVIKFILGAVNLLSPTADNPLRFCEDEAEARAWLEERRRAVAAMGVGRKG
jgi:hypothetical protein